MSESDDASWFGVLMMLTGGGLVLDWGLAQVGVPSAPIFGAVAFILGLLFVIGHRASNRQSAADLEREAFDDE